MALLNNPTFDLHRGYPNGSALAEPFKIHKTAGNYDSLPAGTIVTQELQDGDTVMAAATTPDLSSADPKQVWIVVEGNDDFSGAYTGRCMCVRLGSGFMWKTKNYASGTYTPGTPVSFNAGQTKVKAVNEQIVAYVAYDKTATESALILAA